MRVGLAVISLDLPAITVLTSQAEGRWTTLMVARSTTSRYSP